MKFFFLALLFVSVNCFAADKDICLVTGGINHKGFGYIEVSCDGATVSNNDGFGANVIPANLTKELKSLMSEGLKLVSCATRENLNRDTRRSDKEFNCTLARQ